MWLLNLHIRCQNEKKEQLKDGFSFWEAQEGSQDYNHNHLTCRGPRKLLTKKLSTHDLRGQILIHQILFISHIR
jgi:hypothetical protein